MKECVFTWKDGRGAARLTRFLRKGKGVEGRGISSEDRAELRPSGGNERYPAVLRCGFEEGEPPVRKVEALGPGRADGDKPSPWPELVRSGLFLPSHSVEISSLEQ